jgi:hypothetical protein
MKWEYMEDSTAQYQKQEVPEHMKVQHDETDPFFASSNIEIDDDDLPF